MVATILNVLTFSSLIFAHISYSLFVNSIPIKDMSLEFNTVLYTSLDTNSSSAGKTVGFELAQFSISKLQLNDWKTEFVNGLNEPTLAYFTATSIQQIDGIITEFQNVYKLLSASKGHWQPAFAIFVNTSLEKNMKPEMREKWASKFAANSQAYFLFWDACGNGSAALVSTLEIYSIKNSSIARNIPLEQGHKDCEGFSPTSLVSIIQKRTQRRLDFQRAQIVGINVDEPNYEATTKYRHTNGSSKAEFEGGFEVEEYWYLRDALNFTEVASTWPSFVKQASNGSLTGLAIPINFGLADVCIGYSEFLLYRMAAPNGITFLHPTFHNRIQVFFSQPEASSIRDIFLSPFSQDIWLTIAATWIVIALQLTLFAGVKQKINKDFLNSSDCVISEDVSISVLSAICQKGFHVSPSSPSMRIIFLVGIVLGLLVYTAYSAALVSILSVEVIPVKQFSDLLMNSFEIFSDNHIPTADAVVRSLENNGMIKELAGENGRNVEIGDTIANLVKRRIAVVSFSDSFYQVALKRDYHPNFLCQEISKVVYGRRPAVASMFVKRGSPLREYFNCKIILMKERGILIRLRSHYIQATSVSCLVSGGAFMKQVTLRDVFTAYIIIFVGSILSVTVALLERIYAVYKERSGKETPSALADASKH